MTKRITQSSSSREDSAHVMAGWARQKTSNGYTATSRQRLTVVFIGQRSLRRSEMRLTRGQSVFR